MRFNLIKGINRKKGGESTGLPAFLTEGVSVEIGYVNPLKNPAR